jgi:hypothetical protein
MRLEQVLAQWAHRMPASAGAPVKRWALERLRCEKRLGIMPRATRLFQEAGAFDAAAKLSAEWFRTHFARPA